MKDLFSSVYLFCLLVQINVTAEAACSQRIDLVTDGVGSDDDNIISTLVKYYPGFPYTDRCLAPPQPTTPPPVPRVR